ncbi:HlyD family secretion protein [Salinicola rhizosphaerae]|uniref:Hemolysin D n=1 Tax=Salinicola rhizosphaerae TaxID=1443141 RepID=A0ABQ3EF03_9GAMM|nr:HlyD family secretion protein [Salinicola rhizosphaerae]GHB32550.1 hemolysin D [Salinicola rhizosphaerae]
MKIKKKLYTVAVVVVVLVVALIYGWHWWQTGRFFIETDNAYVRTDSVAVRAELTQKVVRVAVNDNQRVEKGDLLVQLDDRDVRSQLAQSQAQLAVSSANVTQAERQVDLDRASIDEAEAQVASAQSDVDQARQHLQRSQSLAANNYASRQQLDDDRASLNVAQATLKARQASVESAKRQLTADQASIDSAKANREAAEADIAYNQSQLDKTRIVASRAGVIGNRTVEPGNLAQPSLTLMQLVPVSSAYVVANYKETQIERMRVGQPVSLAVDAYPDIAFTGRVDSVAPATGTEFSLLPQDNATGNFNKIVQRVPVKILVTGPKDQLWRLQAGLSVVPSVDTREVDGQAIYFNPGPGLPDGDPDSGLADDASDQKPPDGASTSGQSGGGSTAEPDEAMSRQASGASE